jgi:hypothetical protein
MGVKPPAWIDPLPEQTQGRAAGALRRHAAMCCSRDEQYVFPLPVTGAVLRMKIEPGQESM